MQSERRAVATSVAPWGAGVTGRPAIPGLPTTMQEDIPRMTAIAHNNSLVGQDVCSVGSGVCDVYHGDIAIQVSVLYG